MFKVFTEFVTILLLFYVLVFGVKAGGILAPWPGMEPAPPALEGEVLTTGLPATYSLWIRLKSTATALKLLTDRRALNRLPDTTFVKASSLVFMLPFLGKNPSNEIFWLLSTPMSQSDWGLWRSEVGMHRPNFSTFTWGKKKSFPLWRSSLVQCCWTSCRYKCLFLGCTSGECPWPHLEATFSKISLLSKEGDVCDLHLLTGIFFQSFQSVVGKKWCLYWAPANITSSKAPLRKVI